MTNNHAFTWAGSTTDEYPVADVECGCGNFVAKANTGNIVASEYLKGQISIVRKLEAKEN